MFLHPLIPVRYFQERARQIKSHLGSHCHFLVYDILTRHWFVLEGRWAGLEAQDWYKSVLKAFLKKAYPNKKSWLLLGCFWLLPAILGCSKLLLAVPGCSWLCLAVSQLLLVARGCSWLLLAAFGCFWLLLGHPGRFFGENHGIICCFVKDV